MDNQKMMINFNTNVFIAIVEWRNMYMDTDTDTYMNNNEWFVVSMYGGIYDICMQVIK